MTLGMKLVAAATVTGTIVMMEDSLHHTDLKKDKAGIILHPQPQDTPNDPLNWPLLRKDSCFLILGFQTFIGGGQTAILAAGFSNLEREFHKPLSVISYLVGAYMLALGIGSVFASPTAALYGKRLVYLLGILIFFVGCVVCATAKSYGALMAGRILTGFGASPTESLASASLGELYFQHERAYRTGLYTLLLLGGKNILPLLSSLILQHLGRHWLYWILAMFLGLNLVLTYLFVPETFWDRSPTPNKRSLEETEAARHAAGYVPRDQRPHAYAYPSTSSYSPIRSQRSLSQGRAEKRGHNEEKSSEQEEHKENNVSARTTRKIDPGINQTGTDNVPLQKLPKEGLKSPSPPLSEITDTTAISASTEHAQNSANTISMANVDNRVDFSIPDTAMNVHSESASQHSQVFEEPVSQDSIPRSFRNRLSLFSGRHTRDKWWMVLLRPFYLYSYPGVAYGSIMYSLAVVWLIVISETLSDIFRSPPYGYSQETVGLWYVSPFVGGILGSITAGVMGDRLTRFIVKHNHGIYEPEFRLFMLVPSSIFSAFGLMGYGWSAHNADPWIAPVMFFGCLSFGSSMASTTAITYTVDCYRMYSAEALVNFNLTKNVLGFIFSLFNNNAYAAINGKNIFVVYGSVQLIVSLSGIALFIYGKQLRAWTDAKELLKGLYHPHEPSKNPST